MKKQIILLASCMIFGVGVLYSLFALSPFAADIPRQTFKRNFDYDVRVSKFKEIDLKVNSFYLAGNAQHTLYLGNWTGPFHLVQVSLPSLDTVHMNVKIKGVKLTNDYRTFRMKVDSPYFFLSHGVMPGIFKGLISSLQADNFMSAPVPYFVEAVPVSPSLVVLKALSMDNNENELATLKPDSPYFQFKPQVLQKQIDGFFCVDGLLNYDREISRLVYLYVYRNEYLIMDTALNVINRYHTIDTFTGAPIKVAKVASKNYSTLASPPARINVNAAVSGKLLFVQSPLLAKNEDKIKFQAATAIDVYDLTTGKYRYSFYLDRLEGHSPSSFKVLGNYMAAIYDHRLVVFNLRLPEL